MFITKLPSANKLTVRERRAGERCLFRGESFNTACESAGVKPSRLRAKPAWGQVTQEALDLGPALRAAAAEVKAPEEDITDLLAEIDARSPAAIPVTQIPSEAKSTPISDGCALPGPSSPSESAKPFEPAYDSPQAAEARTAARVAEVEAEAAAKFSEKPLTQAEWIAKEFPPVFDQPITLDGIAGLSPELEEKDPELHATLTRPSMLQIITAGYEAADRDRYASARAAWIEKDRMAGPGSDYMSPSDLARYAKYREQ